jgi:hypothetical protein
MLRRSQQFDTKSSRYAERGALIVDYGLWMVDGDRASVFREEKEGSV